MVVIDKLPFQHPGDPLLKARVDRLRARGHEPFGEYQIPQAVMALCQGFGRLIRTRTDRGVVIVCDPRLVTKAYGKTFRDSLPARTRVFKEQTQLVRAVKEFLKIG